MLLKVKTIAEAMTHNPITVRDDEIVTTVAEKFDRFGFHHLPVVDAEGRIVGIISNTDLERLKLSASIFKTKKQEEYNSALFESLMVRYVMTKNVTHLTSQDTFETAYSIFKQNKFRAIPIVDDDKLVGIISPLDLLDHFFNL